MSRALDFLLAARPRAMASYFSFLDDCGSRLEPKTRALISVITKVAVETESGLVRYTRKAYAAGVTPDEVLDALMMAFPALGLSRIVWAVDVLQRHGVEGFAASGESTQSTSPALDVCALDELPLERAVKYITEDRPLLVYRTPDAVRAFKAYCSHQGMELMPSGMVGARVTCRQHGWVFELPEGRCARGPQWGLEALPVSIVAGRVKVEWPERSAPGDAPVTL